MKYYTGIGSRDCPIWAKQLATMIAKHMDLDWTLRSGGAIGMDTGFEEGSIHKEIYLPWSGFNKRTDGFHDIVLTDATQEDAEEELYESGVCKAIYNLPMHIRKLFARNVYQITGSNGEEHSAFVAYWAPTDKKGNPTGGTSIAVNYAKALSIPTYNLNVLVERNAILSLLKIENNTW